MAQLRDKLGADRAALEAFGDRLTSFRARTPELEATMDAILGRLSEVEDGTKAATRLGELASELDAQLTRVTGRIQFVDKLEGRINTLHVLTADVDRKLAEQLARRAELDTLKTQVRRRHRPDARRPAEGRRRQHRAEEGPAAGQPARRAAGAARAGGRELPEVQQDEAVIREQQARLVELVESSRSLASRNRRSA